MIRLYNNDWPDNYHEIASYYPAFYKDVLEMQSILQAQGLSLDGIQGSIERVYLNNFIDYADEETIANLESLLDISLNKQRTLEERRRLVKSYFVGFGKVSSTMLQEMIQSYTGASVQCRFEPFDQQKNNMLYIDFQRGESAVLYWSDIENLLEKKIPAHIEWRAAILYSFPLAVSNTRYCKHYTQSYQLAGTKPDISTHGSLVGRIDSLSKPNATDCTVDYVYCGQSYSHS